ncbi:MAG TPA: hypothetical protein VF313_06455 [Anaerolineaceae bacterium]
MTKLITGGARLTWAFLDIFTSATSSDPSRLSPIEPLLKFI